MRRSIVRADKVGMFDKQVSGKRFDGTPMGPPAKTKKGDKKKGEK